MIHGKGSMTMPNIKTYFRKVAVEIGIRKLNHARICKGPCSFNWCKKMKRIIKHKMICKAKHGTCNTCMHLVSVCFYHVKQCRKDNCKLMQCCLIKKGLKAKKEERIKAQAEQIAAEDEELQDVASFSININDD